MLCFAGRDGSSLGSKDASAKKVYLHCQVVPADTSQAASSSASDRSDPVEESPVPSTSLAAHAIPEETPFQQKAQGAQGAEGASLAEDSMARQEQRLKRALLLGGVAMLLLLAGHWLPLGLSSRSTILGSVVMVAISLAVLAGAWAAYSSGWLEQKLPSAAHLAGTATHSTPVHLAVGPCVSDGQHSIYNPHIPKAGLGVEDFHVYRESCCGGASGARCTVAADPTAEGRGGRSRKSRCDLPYESATAQSAPQCSLFMRCLRDHD